MSDLDVRDLGGRLARLCASVVIGGVCALVITCSLPTRMHFSGCMHGEGWLVVGGDPVLMLAGVIAIALGVYPLLGSVQHLRRRSPRLPRATLLRSRC